MTKKQYSICRLLIIIILSFSISISLNLKNYFLPIIFMFSAMAIMYYCRKQLKTEDVLADERDYKIAGDAARYSIYIFGLFGAVTTFVLMALSEKQQNLYLVSQFFAFSVCFLLLLNAFLFKFLSKRKE